MYIEVLKLLVLIGLVVRGVMARFWLAAAVALAMIYASVGLVAVHLFGKRYPPFTELLSHQSLPIFVGMLAIAAAVYALGQRGATTRPSWREVTELFGLVAILGGLQLVLALLVR